MMISVRRRWAEVVTAVVDGAEAVAHPEADHLEAAIPEVAHRGAVRREDAEVVDLVPEDAAEDEVIFEFCLG